MHLWQCAYSDGQRFQYQYDAAILGRNSGCLIKVAAAPDYCVVFDFESPDIQLWQCDPTKREQRWHLRENASVFPGNTFRNDVYYNWCIVPDGESGKNGNKISFRSCDAAKE